MRLLPPDPELGWTPYVWLVYLGMPLAAPSFGWGEPHWLGTSVLVASFLPLYFHGYWLRGWPLAANAAAQAALGFAGVLFNGGANVFWVYAAANLGRTGRPARGARLLAVLLGAIALASWWFRLHVGIWFFGGLFSALVGGINIHFAEVSRQNAKLRRAHDEVERLATLAERERIARDLHDLLGHSLSVIVLKSELAARLSERDPERAAREIREVETISRQALSEVRGAVQGYRIAAGSLDRELANARRALDGAQIELRVDRGPAEGLVDVPESVLALALREAVTNVIRHAGASLCRVRFFIEEGVAHLVVSDDGRGGDALEGAGLAGMRERVEAFGGRVRRDGSAGTRLEVAVPLAPKAAT